MQNKPYWIILELFAYFFG